MPTVMNRHHSHHISSTRSAIQKVCIGMGIAFIVIGLAGVINPSFLGMHLSFAHNLIHLASGSLALWCAYSDDNKKAYSYCIGFGSVYGLLGLAGFVIGQPGYPALGNMEADQNLLRVIPNVIEFGSADHVVHLFISAVLLYSAYTWKKRDLYVGRGIVDVQRRRDTSRTEVDLSEAPLGTLDIDRDQDQRRREDFERRI